jgi:hypothetical protein
MCFISPRDTGKFYALIDQEVLLLQGVTILGCSYNMVVDRVFAGALGRYGALPPLFVSRVIFVDCHEHDLGHSWDRYVKSLRLGLLDVFKTTGGGSVRVFFSNGGGRER